MNVPTDRVEELGRALEATTARSNEGASDPWSSAMRRGDFETAWRVADAVLESRKGVPCWELPRHLQYIWQGQPITGRRVLVRCYHGLGDTLQFLRFLPLLAARASQVVVWCQPVLIPLARTLVGGEHLQWLPLHDGVPEAEYDVDVELMEIPHLLRIGLRTLPGPVPYLRVEALPRQGPGSARDVGITWRAGDWDQRRSLPIELVRRLAQTPNVRLHSLQRGSGAAEWRVEYGIDSSSDDPMEAARAMKSLDLVISVDSMPAHLAGALGVPVWTLLHAEPDWRWMEWRNDTPWYPTMRLYRQPSPGDWADVIRRVAHDLADRQSALGWTASL